MAGNFAPTRKKPAFATRVVSRLKQVPRGRLATYRSLAAAAGCPGAARAVGNVLAQNRQLLKIPRHRIVRSDGLAGGYRLGQKRKIEILRQEGIRFGLRGKILNFKKILHKF